MSIESVLTGGSRWHVEHGDCLDVLRALPSACADAVVTDPPYGTTQNAWDVPFDLAAWWTQVERVTKPNAAIVLFAQTPFDKVLGASRLDLLRYEWIWRKNKGTGHLNAKRAPLKAHENVLVFARKQPTYNPQKAPSGRPLKTPYRQGPSSLNYGAQVQQVWTDDGTRYPTSVLDFPMERPNVHPTQKPVDLCRYLIRTYTDPGAFVLDPFAGSGTTGVAAVHECVRFIGVEREAEYVEIARKRITSATTSPAQSSLFTAPVLVADERKESK